MQTLKNKAFRVSIQWNALVRKPLALKRGGFTILCVMQPIVMQPKSRMIKNERFSNEFEMLRGVGFIYGGLIRGF